MSSLDEHEEIRARALELVVYMHPGSVGYLIELASKVEDYIKYGIPAVPETQNVQK